MRPALTHLSAVDLKRLRKAYAKAQMARSGNPRVRLREGVAYIEEEYALEEELRREYQVDEDEEVEFDPIDGAIVPVAEEE